MTDKSVSQGNKVIFTDFNSNYEELDGEFRKESLTSNNNSQVSALYSPGVIEPGQPVFIVGTVLNKDGSKTNISDTVKFFTTQKNQ